MLANPIWQLRSGCRTEQHHRTVAIVDVRRRGEWAESHIAGAMHIPIHELLSRIAEVPNQEVWVHCAAGYRATAAASLLAARAARVVVVNDSFASRPQPPDCH